MLIQAPVLRPLKTLKAWFYLLLLMVSFGFMSSLPGCNAAPGSESTGEFIDSSTLTAKVKADLIDALGTKAFSIQVKTFKDEVQLSGFVNSAYLKKRAEIIASDHVSITHVRNDLIVR